MQWMQCTRHLRKPKRGTGILYQGLFKRYNNNNNIRIRIMRHQIRKGRAQYEIRQYLNSSERVLRCDTLHAAIKEIATGIVTARYSFFFKVRARGWSTYCHAAHNFENAKKKMENICNFFCLDRWNIPPPPTVPIRTRADLTQNKRRNQQVMNFSLVYQSPKVGRREFSAQTCKFPHCSTIGLGIHQRVH